jgi:hypothetical protein
MRSDDQLKERLTANPSNMPVFAADLEDVARRKAVHRRRRLVVGGAAFLLVAAGVVAPLIALAPLARHDRGPASVGPSPTVTASSTPSPPPGSNPLTWPPLKYVSLVSQRVISSSADSLVVEAPVGVARWSLRGCSVEGGPADVKRPRSGGFGSGACGPGTQLSAGVGGASICTSFCSTFNPSGPFYYVISGRTIPDPGVHIVVTFPDGTTTTVIPSLGLWMVVFRAHPEKYNPTHTAIVRAIAMDGTILATEHV